MKSSTLKEDRWSEPKVLDQIDDPLGVVVCLNDKDQARLRRYKRGAKGFEKNP